jgi:hypothetical protein
MFKELVKDFGSVSDDRRYEPIDGQSDLDAPLPISRHTPKSGTKLMLEEERLTGEVKWATYSRYLKAIGNWWWSLIISAALILEQAASIGNSLMLGYWSEGKIAGFSQGSYMALYAGMSNRWFQYLQYT